MAKVATGLVENETFYLDGGIVLQGIQGLTINQCRFVFRGLKDGEYMITLGDGCDRTTISNCNFMTEEYQ